VSSEAFARLEEALRSEGPQAALDLVADEFRSQKNYPKAMEARLMKKRRELGLPLIQAEVPDGLPEPVRRAYEEAFVEAARETGTLFLNDGDIVRAWPYFRALGEPGPVAAAIERLAPAEDQDAILEIAYLERVNPRKGFELILADHGLCRAITFFDQYPGREGKQESRRLLVRTLHRELVESLKHAIARAEGQAPETESVGELIEGREWLFGEHCYYVDTSHLVAVLRFSLESEDIETLWLAVELAEYGRRLHPMFHFPGQPPFENVYEDSGIYLRALAGEDVTPAKDHFQRKIDGDDTEAAQAAAQALVALLARRGLYAEAIQVSLAHLGEAPAGQLACPSVFELCQASGDHARLMELARERGDLLSFVAGAARVTEPRP